MAKKKSGRRFGYLPPKYNFSLNPYPELRFFRCPDCQNKSGQRKLPLLIHVDPRNLIAHNYTCRYCHRCDMLIAHKHEIENHLTRMFSEISQEFIGNRYLIFGTVEKKAWRENIKEPKSLYDMRQHISDFRSYQSIRMTMGGWFPKDQEPPVMKPPPSKEWIKKTGNDDNENHHHNIMNGN